MFDKACYWDDRRDLEDMYIPFPVQMLLISVLSFLVCLIGTWARYTMFKDKKNKALSRLTYVHTLSVIFTWWAITIPRHKDSSESLFNFFGYISMIMFPLWSGTFIIMVFHFADMIMKDPSEESPGFFEAWAKFMVSKESEVFVLVCHVLIGIGFALMASSMPTAKTYIAVANVLFWVRVFFIFATWFITTCVFWYMGKYYQAEVMKYNSEYTALWLFLAGFLACLISEGARPNDAVLAEVVFGAHFPVMLIVLMIVAMTSLTSSASECEESDF